MKETYNFVPLCLLVVYHYTASASAAVVMTKFGSHIFTGSAFDLLTHWGRCKMATLKHIFWNENIIISIKISLTFVPEGPINNIPELVQITAWCRPGDKPLSEPMMVSLPTHICVIRPQWVKPCYNVPTVHQRHCLYRYTVCNCFRDGWC